MFLNQYPADLHCWVKHRWHHADTCYNHNNSAHHKRLRELFEFKYKQMKTLRIIAATLGATVTGIAIGVLFAPNKGYKTRQKLSRKSHEYADYITDSFDDMVDFITHSIENVENET